MLWVGTASIWCTRFEPDLCAICRRTEIFLPFHFAFRLIFSCAISCNFYSFFAWQPAACRNCLLSLYKVIHKSVKHVRKLADAIVEWKDSNDYIFQQDGSRSHYKDVRGYLDRNLPQRWVGRTGKEDDALMRWPPRSPDLTSCHFFFWGFVPQLHANLQIFATVSPLPWLWSTVMCWHACGTRWTIE